MDWFDIAEYCTTRCGDHDTDARTALAAIGTSGLEKALAIGVHTDILFPLQQQQEIAEGLRAGGCDAGFLPLPSPQGHDAFLVDIDRFGPAIRAFLDSL
jgi:homoserine O-acetyltransferase